MILIITRQYDESSCKVINWIKHFRKDNLFYRLNCDAVEELSIYFNIERNKLFVNDIEVQKIWFRKPTLALKSAIYDFEDLLDLNHIIDAFFFSSKNKRNFIGSPAIFRNSNRAYIEKTICDVFRISSNSFITNQRNESWEKDYITKSVGDFVKVSELNKKRFQKKFSMNDDLCEFNLYQQLIQNSFEVRSVYIKGVFYSILKIKAPNGIIDARTDMSIRVQKYRLPEKVQKQIKVVLDKLKLDFATMDILIDTEMNFRVIDINPQGIFDNVDFAYNNQISKLIAQLLCEKIKVNQNKKMVVL